MRAGVVLVVVVALLAVPGCSVEWHTVHPPAPATPAHPPVVGPPVVVDSSVPGWRTSVWLADDELFCVRAARVPGKWKAGRENEFIFCDPAPSILASTGSPSLAGKPLPFIAPLDAESRKIILVGTVRGRIASVSVTMFGETATSAVHRLPTTGGRYLGAYAVWLPRSRPGNNGMHLSDITAVVGRDDSGDVVTRLP